MGKKLLGEKDISSAGINNVNVKNKFSYQTRFPAFSAGRITSGRVTTTCPEILNLLPIGT
jgi:hypothetical protein